MANVDIQYLLQASEALSRETDPIALQKTLMQSILEYSGVDEGYFFLPCEAASSLESPPNNVVNKSLKHAHQSSYYCSLQGILQHDGEHSAITFNLNPVGESFNCVDPIIRECQQTRQTIILNKLHDQGRFHAATTGKEVKSILCKPIVHRQTLLAIIYLHDKSRENVFGKQLLAFIELLSKQAAISLTTSRLLKEQTELTNNLNQSQEILATVFNHSFHYLTLTDPDGRIIKVNQAAINNFDLNENDVVGKVFWQTPWFKHSQKLQKLVADYFSRCSTQGRQVLETFHYLSNKNHQRVYFENTFSPVFNNRGQLNFILIEGHNISKQRSSEKTLQKNNRQFQFALEGSQQGIFEVNFTTQKMYVSKEIRAMLGEDTSNDNLTSISAWEKKIHPDDLKKVREGLYTHISNNTQHFSAECRTKNHDDCFIWMLYRGMVTELSKQKEPLQAIGTITDITERKTIESALLENEKRYRSIFENALDGIMILDKEGQILDANTAALWILRYSKAKDMIGTPFTRLLHDEENYTFQYIQQQILTHGSIEFESECQTLEGGIVPVNVRGKVFCDQTDSNYLIILSDISERKKSEQELKQSEALSRQFFQQYPIGTALTNPDGSIHLINPACEKEWGVKQSTLKNRQYNILKDKNFTKTPATLALISKALSGETVYFDDIEYQPGPQSNTKWIRVIGFPIKDESGELIHSVFTHQIVSREVEALREIELHRRHLQEMVEQRTRDLETANEELQNFAYIVSHDLKAPLRAIIQLSNWLTNDYQDKLNAEGNKQLLLIGNRANRMNDMIEGILQYSRIGRTQEEWETVNLKSLVDDIIDLLAPPENLKFVVSENLPTVRCQKIRVSQVFQNLIDNAIKYIDKADGLIQVGVKENKDNWQFFVKDNGPGIRLNHQQRIFQMFQTLHNKEDINSTGIGLPLVKKIIEQWQGVLWLESIPEQGSCFQFTLPKF